MRRLVPLIAASLVVVPAATSAKPPKHRAKVAVRHPSPTVDGGLSHPRTQGWYDHDANKLAIGTLNWWDQMVREGRARR
jgi:hypothetical protein